MNPPVCSFVPFCQLKQQKLAIITARLPTWCGAGEFLAYDTGLCLARSSPGTVPPSLGRCLCTDRARQREAQALVIFSAYD